MQMVLVMKLRLNVIKLTTMVMSLWILVVSQSQLIKLNLQLITVSLSLPNILMLLVGVSWGYVFLDVHYQCKHVKLESDLSLHSDLFSQ